jgi:outer membrane protein assembly factor BamA
MPLKPFRRRPTLEEKDSMFAILLLLASVPIQNIEIRGNKTVPSEVVAALSGLKPGQAADRPEFDTACTRIIRTGFFTSCNYAFASNGTRGNNVTLQVEEAERTQSVRLEIPGLDQSKFQAQEPLFGTRIPLSDMAAQTYVTALQRFLKTKEAPNVDVDLQHKETVISFGEGKKVARREPDPTPHVPKTKLVFGELIIKGLPQFTERRVRTLWTIQPGDPITETTADDFVSEVFEAKVVPVEFQDAKTSTDPRPNSNTADVTITFRNGSNPP